MRVFYGLRVPVSAQLEFKVSVSHSLRTNSPNGKPPRPFSPRREGYQPHPSFADSKGEGVWG